VRLVIQAELETLRVYERQSCGVDRGRCALSACCLLDTATAAAQLLPPADTGHPERLQSASQTSSPADCAQMMRDVNEKFNGFRVSAWTNISVTAYTSNNVHTDFELNKSFCITEDKST